MILYPFYNKAPNLNTEIFFKNAYGVGFHLPQKPDVGTCTFEGGAFDTVNKMVFELLMLLIYAVGIQHL